MKKHIKLFTVVFIIIVLAILWIRSFYGDAKFKISGTILLVFTVLFAIGATWLLYSKKWRQVLGLTTNGITGNIILKAFAMGMLINFVGSIFIFLIYFLIFRETPTSLLGENNTLKIIPIALVIAPLTEELLFRGFMQGLWQELYKNKEKSYTKLIIIVTALLFTISHFHFLFNISIKQFLLFLIPLFIGAVYFSWLRYKCQSIIPSMFAHFGYNSLMIIAPLIMAVFVLASPSKYRELRREQEVSRYINDTMPYNFDPNNMDEWERSYKKFAVLERPRSEEVIKHLKGTATNVHVYFTIDTCGNIHNIKGIDTIWVKTSLDKIHKYTAEAYYIQEYGYDFTEEAIKFIKSLPQCKPYIIDGKKVELEMSASVPFSPY